MTPAAADFVRFTGLLTCWWCNYIAKRFEAFKTKKRAENLAVSFFCCIFAEKLKRYATETQTQKSRVGCS